MKMAGIFGVAVVAAASSVASAQTVLYDTGLHETVLFNGAASNLGWTSGNASASQPQRYTAQAFTLGAGPNTINEIHPDYFVQSPLPTDVGWIIWSRNGTAAPTQADELASGSSPYTAAGDAFTIPDVNLPGGDYYLTVYGIGGLIFWFTGAPDGIPILDGNGDPFTWRSETYPAPGVLMYQLPLAVLAANAGDPEDTYNAAFSLSGVPAPSSLALLGLGGLVAARRRRH